jgi:hypothetical protein
MTGGSGGLSPWSGDLLGDLPEEPDDGWSSPLFDPSDPAGLPLPTVSPRPPTRPPALSWAEVAALSAAEDTLSRLDQAALLASDAVRAGLTARLAAREASAWLGAQGCWIHPRDLALHEAGLVSSIAAAVSGGRARDALPATLAGRREAEVHDLAVEDVADDALIVEALSFLRTLRRLPGARDPLEMVLQGAVSPMPDQDRPALLQAHDLACRCHAATSPMPSLLAAAWLGRGRMRAIFAPVWTGLQGLRHARWPASGDITIWCRALTEGGRVGLQELARLQQAEARGQHLVQQCDRRSRLGDVLAEMVRQPVVTSVGIARQLRMTQQAASRLLQALAEAGLATEVTGRATWRVYAVASS